MTTATAPTAHATLSPDQLLRALEWRYATKKFDASRIIPAPIWQALERSLVLAPSSFGLQPWKFFVVDDSALRAKLRAAAWNQAQITDASHLVVLARRSPLEVADVAAFIQRLSEVRGAPLESLAGYRAMIEGFITAPTFRADDWTARQVYIALGGFLSAAALLGVDACPMEGFDPKVFDDLLGLPSQGYRATVVATAGYRAADDAISSAPKVRFPHQTLVHHR